MPKRFGSAAAGPSSKKTKSKAVGGRRHVGARAALEPHHHVLVQALLARKYMLDKEAREIYREAAGEEDDSGYTEYWAAINEALNFIGMGLRRTAYKHEDNKLYIGIVNKVADSPSKTSGTRLTPGELSLFRLIVEEITNNCPDGELPMMQAINVRVPEGEAPDEDDAVAQTQYLDTQQVAGMRTSDKEAALDKIESEGWIRNDDGMIKLGVRTFLELEDLVMPN